MNIFDDLFLAQFEWPSWLRFPRIFGLPEVESAMVFLASFVAIFVIIFVIEVTVKKRSSENNERKSMAWNRRERKKKDIKDAKKEMKTQQKNLKQSMKLQEEISR